ncbi:hypothetical protein PGTUg99_020413 [Puccinia graminis f. sp. tritici]|uniref:HTH APSES-type domain-containing protein n=2 Tax=Puccinia graminis f. sp. tritici TaxID=56615 RepID=A0A5B0RWP5_PUCGR|nr:hypothetical protein PGTUg99_020413 [Puccinia graminis f. sp. tritici]
MDYAVPPFGMAYGESIQPLRPPSRESATLHLHQPDLTVTSPPLSLTHCPPCVYSHFTHTPTSLIVIQVSLHSLLDQETYHLLPSRSPPTVSVRMGTTTIYKATYSGVPVLEMPCEGIAVMRRRSDSWLNATQILKVAGFDKPQRTRVLEREIQKGTHEKIQGGYGKYQGTWVPLDRGIDLAKQYGVDHLLSALFNFQPSSNESPPLAPKHVTALSTRVKVSKVSAASAARAARAVVPSLPSTSGLGGRNTNNSWSNFDSDNEPGLPPAASSRESNGNWATQSKLARSSNLARARANINNSHPEDLPVPAPDQLQASPLPSMQTADPENDNSLTPSELSLPSRTPSPIEDLPLTVNTASSQSTRNKGKSRDLPDDEDLSRGQKRKYDTSLVEDTSYSDGADDQYINGNPSNAASAKYAKLILDYFVSESSQIPNFLNDPPSDFDPNVVIDDDGHTALHWACAMGRIKIIKLLLTCGADIFRANNAGQTALMRAVMFTNNHDLRTFPELFESFSGSVINIDRTDRTVFHYVIDIALTKGKVPAARYYLETILSQLSEYPKELIDILNFQDEDGETALTLAARCRSKKLVKILLDHGANPKTANRDGKSAEDYILEDDKFRALSPTPCSSGPIRQLDQNSPGGTSNRSDFVDLVDPVPIDSNLIPQRSPNASPPHYSETGQRVTKQLLPEVTSMIELLATTFDTELQDKERDLDHAVGLLSNIEKEYLEGQRKILNYERMLSDFGEKKLALGDLEKELNDKLGKRYRFGWEKYVRDEEERARRITEQRSKYLQELSIEDRKLLDSSNLRFADPSKQEVLMKLQADERENSDLLNLIRTNSTDVESECDLLRESVQKLSEERERLFKEFINLSSENTGGENEEEDGANHTSANTSRLNNYRKLISLGCGGIGLDEVDEVIESLNEGIDVNELNDNGFLPEQDEELGNHQNYHNIHTQGR